MSNLDAISEAEQESTAGVLRAAAARTAAVIRAAGAPGTRVPRLEWTVAETALHVVAEFRDWTAYASGQRRPSEGDPADSPSRRSAAANAAQLRADPERDLDVLADRLIGAVEGYLALPPGDEPVPISSGLAVGWPVMTSALLSELLVHGFDIARATGQPWQIERSDALRVIAGVMTMLPDYLDRGRAGRRRITFEIRLRGGPSYRVAVADGKAQVTEGTGGARPDCWISADPATFMLVGYGRLGQWGPIVSGRLRAGGRKPWLATKFSSLITGP